MSPSIRIRLSAMMFLQYAFQGIWVIPLVTYLMQAGYTGAEVGTMYGTIAIGFIVAPFFVGMIADRFFSAQHVLGVLNILAAVFLFAASQMAVTAEGDPQPRVFMWILLAHCICYTPSWALTNTIALNQMKNPGKEFPSIRVMGTIGWIVVSAITLFSAPISAFAGFETSYEASKLPMILGAFIGLAAGGFAFLLPNTPPKKTDHPVSAGDILGLKALDLLRERNFAVFTLCSFLIMLPGTFYWVFCNGFLNEIEWGAVAFKQSFGQMSEFLFLICMPFFFARFGVKKMLLIGMVAWFVRFVCFSFGDTGSMVGLLWLGIVCHGVCFDFFFVTGQLYVDKKAPKEIQAQAQGFITLITFGVGWFVGTKIAGGVVDRYVCEAADAAAHDWQRIWYVPAAMALVIMILFVACFNDKAKVGHEDEPGPQESAEA